MHQQKLLFVILLRFKPTSTSYLCNPRFPLVFIPFPCIGHQIIIHSIIKYSNPNPACSTVPINSQPYNNVICHPVTLLITTINKRLSCVVPKYHPIHMVLLDIFLEKGLEHIFCIYFDTHPLGQVTFSRTEINKKIPLCPCLSAHLPPRRLANRNAKSSWSSSSIRPFSVTYFDSLPCLTSPRAHQCL